MPARTISTFRVSTSEDGQRWIARGWLPGGIEVEAEGATPWQAASEARQILVECDEIEPHFQLAPPSSSDPQLKRLWARLNRGGSGLLRLSLCLHVLLITLVYLAVWADSRSGLLPIVLFPIYLPVFAFVFALAPMGLVAQPLLFLTFGTAWIWWLVSRVNRWRHRRTAERYLHRAALVPSR